MTSLDQPLISFVATSRNDDHGGDVLRRTQSFVDLLAKQCGRHQLRGELVLVDWNPPVGRPSLADVLNWPKGGEWFTAKVVTVPPHVHLGLPNARGLSMYQMIAKNVGIRRAAGDFVVATNIDIIFSDELFTWLKSTNLNDDSVYRSDRWDIPNSIQLEDDFDLLLARAHKEAIRKNLAEGTHTLVDGVWQSEGLTRVDRYLLGAIDSVLKHSLAMIENGHLPDREIRILIEDILPRSRRFYLTPSTHLNGCGDFTMMSHAAWKRLRGYPEWPIFSWNIDSVSLVHAAFEGLSLSVTPSNAVHYHIEHDYGSGYTPGGGMNALLRKLAQKGTPLLDWSGYQELLIKLSGVYESGGSVTFNDDDWGFATLDLPIRSVSADGSPATRAWVRNHGRHHETFATDGLTSRRLEPYDAQGALDHELGWEDGEPCLHFYNGALEGELLRWQLPHECRTAGGTIWVRLRCHIRSGEAKVSIVDVNGSPIRSMSDLHPSDGRREVVICVPSGNSVHALVLTALSPDPLSLTVGAIDVLGQAALSTEAHTQGFEWITLDVVPPVVEAPRDAA